MPDFSGGPYGRLPWPALPPPLRWHTASRFPETFCLEERPLGRLFLAADEFFQTRARGLVRRLLRRRLHEEGARREQGTLDPAVHRDLAAANRVDHDPGRVGGVP